MAELADALDSGDVTSVITSNLESTPSTERSFRVKLNGHNFIRGHGDRKSGARFRLRHLGDNL